MEESPFLNGVGQWHMAQKTISIIDDDYKEWLVSVKADSRRSQIKAATKVNMELVAFNWRLGRSIHLLRAEARWGSAFYDTLSRDLKSLLPESKGFSPINLRYRKGSIACFRMKMSPKLRDKLGSLKLFPKLGKNFHRIPRAENGTKESPLRPIFPLLGKKHVLYRRTDIFGPLESHKMHHRQMRWEPRKSAVLYCRDYQK